MQTFPRAAALTAVGLVLAVTTRATAQDLKRGYAPTRVTLTIDGKASTPRAVDGGYAVADVIVEPAGPTGMAKKHLGAIRYEDIVVQADLDDEPLMSWVAHGLDKPTRHNGSVAVGDLDGKGGVQRDFMNGLITGFTVPTLDAASRELGVFTVRIAPEAVMLRNGVGGEVAGRVGPKQRQWLVSNFRVEMDGLDGTRVLRVDSFTIQRGAAHDTPGSSRDYSRIPAAADIPDLVLSIAEPSASKWAAWYEDFVVKGQNTDANEKNGAIIFLAPDLKSELARLTLGNCGVRSYALAMGAPGGARATVTLYCERMAFQDKSPGA